jgi:diguanylate cyclase (GGDEF)-like protein/putative nucleotidyltransferase with HDIG domain
MFARGDREELERKLAMSRERITELETEILRRGRDALTGSLPIEHFRGQLSDEMQRVRRHNVSGSLALLQVDGIGDVHREHGFESGDMVLRKLVETLHAGTRAEDLVARMSDDSFALLLRESDDGAARACVDRVLLELERLEVGPVRGIGLSVGIASLRNAENPVQLFDQANQALSDAQSAGGGRLVTSAECVDQGDELVERLHRRDAVEALAVALLERDRYTGEHSESVVEMACSVARALGLQSTQIEHVRQGALLHDIGKVGIPDAILNKPGPLTPEERAVMAEHPVIGERILRGIGGFAPVADIVRHEHESWDGSGYPDKLIGPDIPIGSRIILACDAYHAMTSDRPYRARMSHGDAFAELSRCAGRQFDPDVTQSLIGHLYNERSGRLSVVN